MGETRPQRRPTILSEHGEGYCRVCRFVVGLDSAGRLESHRRGSSMVNSHSGDAPRCAGSYRAPAAVTPVTSTKSAFRVTGSKVTCHVCGKQVGVDTYISPTSGDTYRDHRDPSHGGRCEATWRPVR